MNAILLIGHAPLASALRDAALHVLPDVAADLMALDVFSDEPPETAVEVARALVAQRKGGAVLVLTDVIGATPCNIAAELAHDDGVPVLAGMNLPMLLRALNYRDEPLAEMTQRALEGGTRGVVAVEARSGLSDTADACHDA